jgi:FKBP-type peptidyl-prolyl cis-trans isomerase (trigger factor)
MMSDRRTSEEMKRREEELYDKVREATSVELASELIETEVQEMVRDLHERLERQGTNITDWLKATNKDEKSVVDEMRTIAKSRTVLRFGMQEMAEKLKIEPDAEELSAAVKATEARAKAEGHALPKGELTVGGSMYENLRYELRMQAFRDQMIRDEKKLAA